VILQNFFFVLHNDEFSKKDKGGKLEYLFYLLILLNMQNE